MFKTESQLVSTIKSNYAQLCNWSYTETPICLLEEVDLGFGIADLVISKVKPFSIDGYIELNYFDINIYSIISEKPSITFSEIINITKVKRSVLNKSIERLTSLGYIREIQGCFKVRLKYKPVINSSIAIEAKLRNWRRALDQAFRYKWFASQAYVVLDSHFINAASNNLNEFIRLNVGLAEIGKCGKIIIHYSPKKEKPINAKMLILLNERIKQYHLDFKKESQVSR